MLFLIFLKPGYHYAKNQATRIKRNVIKKSWGNPAKKREIFQRFF